MIEHEVIDVAVAPPKMATDSLVEQVAVITNKDVNSTRRILGSKIPRIAIQLESQQEAETIVRKFETLGLSAFIYPESELRKTSIRFKARVLEFGDKIIVFRDKRGETRIIDADKAFLIIKGTWQINQEKEIISVKKKINLTAMLLTGGLPIRRTVLEKSSEISIQTVHFMRLYEKNSSDSCIEIYSQDFDYSSLGKGMGLSSMVNFTALATRMRQIFPGVVFEDNLKESSMVKGSDSVSQENLDISCRLIHRYYQVFSNPGCKHNS